MARVMNNLGIRPLLSHPPSSPQSPPTQYSLTTRQNQTRDTIILHIRGGDNKRRCCLLGDTDRVRHADFAEGEDVLPSGCPGSQGLGRGGKEALGDQILEDRGEVLHALAPLLAAPEAAVLGGAAARARTKDLLESAATLWRLAELGKKQSITTEGNERNTSESRIERRCGRRRGEGWGGGGGRGGRAWGWPAETRRFQAEGTAFHRERREGGENGERKEEGIGGEDIVFLCNLYYK